MKAAKQFLRMPRFRPAAAGVVLACAGLTACSDAVTSPGGGYPPPPPPPPAVTAEVSWCLGAVPAWVAFQDGDGPWTRAFPAVEGGNTTFRYDFHGDRGGIATAMTSDDGPTSLSVLYGAPSELATAGVTRPSICNNLESKTLLGTVAGLDADEIAVVSGGLLSRILVAAAEGNDFELKALPSGPRDYLAARSTQADGQTTIRSLILRRDVNLPDGTTLPVFDFTSAEAFQPAPATLTINGMGPEGASVGFRLITGTSDILLAPVLGASPDVTRSYPGLPLARLRPGDLQVLTASATDGLAGRVAQLYFRSPADLALTLPARLVRPAIDMVSTAPFLRPRARFVAQDDFERLASMTYQQGLTTIVSVAMTATYAARTVSGYELVVPDLSGAAGFDPTWALQPNRQLLWTANRVGGTLGLGIDAMAGDGTIRRSAFDAGAIP